MFAPIEVTANELALLLIIEKGSEVVVPLETVPKLRRPGAMLALRWRRVSVGAFVKGG